MSDARWYVIHTYSGYENKVKDTLLTIVENRNLQDMIIDVKIPIETVTEIDKNGKQKVREEIKGGPNNNPVPRETLENISLLYLGAIRNAETDLRPAKTSQIAGILYSVANEADRKRIEDMLVKTNHSIATDSAVKKTEEIINRNLLNIEKDEMNEQVHISLIDPQFDSVATALKIDYVSERYLKITKEELKAILDEFSLTEDDIKEFIITGRNDPNKKFVNLKKLYGNIRRKEICSLI